MSSFLQDVRVIPLLRTWVILARNRSPDLGPNFRIRIKLMNFTERYCSGCERLLSLSALLTPGTFTPLRGVHTWTAWREDAGTQRVSGVAHPTPLVALEIRPVPPPPARGRREPALAPPTAAASPSSALGSSCEDPRGAVRGCTGFVSPCDPSGRSPTPQRSPLASGIQLRAETRSATRRNRGRRWGGLPPEAL